MKSNKLTKYAFNLADIICWLFVILSVLNVIFTFVVPKVTMWSIPGASVTTTIILEFINTLLGGVGFYLIIKRKVIGFALVFITSAFMLLASKLFLIESLYLFVAILIIIGLPWLLSYKEAVNAKAT